jgi:carboxyl-terminal processing protease
MKKITKISKILIVGAIFFSMGFYIGFKNVPETKKVYGLENIKNSEVADFSEFWRVWNVINERHPGGSNISSEEKMWGAINGLLESLNDPYSYFFTPEEAEELKVDLSGEFFGVGMEVGMREENLVVITPLKNSPAERAGVMPGDIILKIDDVSTQGFSIDRAVKMIRGEKGTTVTLTFARDGESSPIEISIVRDLVKVPTVDSKLQSDGIFIISLFDFSRNAEIDFAKALDEFVVSKSKKLIIDLRGNPGGFLGSSINITSWFLEEGKPIVIEKSAKGKKTNTFRSGSNFLVGDYEMIVLIDGGSASASEIMAGALQENGRAKLLGTKTFGKGSVQELISFKGGTELKMTVAEWLTPNGLSISKEGLTPDYEIKFDVEKYRKDGIDNQLEEAIKILLEKN